MVIVYSVLWAACIKFMLLVKKKECLLSVFGKMTLLNKPPMAHSKICNFPCLDIGFT